MCLLTYLSPGTLPNPEHLACGATFNNDGHGYAIVTADSTLVVGRGLDADEMINAFIVDRYRHPEGPAMFHSRMATHGAEDITNVHPFPVSGDQRTVIAHNGILPIGMQPVRGESRSDTALLAARLGQRFGSLRHARVRAKIEKWMGTGNKLVVLTTNRAHDASAYILNEAAGTWVQGAWYSNDGYLPYSDRYTSTYTRRHWWAEDEDVNVRSYPWERDDDLDSCDLCNSMLASGDHYLGRCSACLSCLDCLEHVRDCQCWSPEKVRAEILDRDGVPVVIGPPGDPQPGDWHPLVKGGPATVSHQRPYALES